MRALTLVSLLILHTALRAQNNIAAFVAEDISKIHLYWKIDSGKSATTIRELLQKQPLVFAMNGGMFHPDYSPVGLYIQNYKQVKGINKAKSGGNFAMQPNGVFYITSDNKAVICKTDDFRHSKKIKYATQSGPMLLINGQFHPAFRQGSANINVRNGVGILPNGKVLFAISRGFVNFYDFALFFQQQGCKNALYLDGAISEMYCPQINLTQQSGSFGVIIGVVK